MEMVTSVDTSAENIDLVVWLQDYTNDGLEYLVSFIQGKSQKVPEFPQVRVFLIFVTCKCNYILFCFLSLWNNLWLLNMQTIYIFWGLDFHYPICCELKWLRNLDYSLKSLYLELTFKLQYKTPYSALLIFLVA